jgi:hypothetical protein
MPVIAKRKAPGYQNSMLVLWSKTFTQGEQAVGVIYGERGYRVAVFVSDPRIGEEVDLPYIRDGHVKYYYQWFASKVKASTTKIALDLDQKLRNAEIEAKS